MRAGVIGERLHWPFFRGATPLEQVAETTGVNAERRGAWGFATYWTRDWPRWLRIALPILLVIGIPAAIILTGLNIDFRNLTITRAETEKEKNCRSESQAVVTSDEGFNSHIGALNDQMSTLVRDMDEIRKKCLAEAPQKITPRFSRFVDCDTPPDFLTNEDASGRYARVLREFAHQQEDIRSRVAALQEQKRQQHQRLSELCSSH
jgi:hypothetical protein